MIPWVHWAQGDSFSPFVFVFAFELSVHVWLCADTDAHNAGALRGQRRQILPELEF